MNGKNAERLAVKPTRALGKEDALKWEYLTQMRDYTIASPLHKGFLLAFVLGFISAHRSIMLTYTLAVMHQLGIS